MSAMLPAKTVLINCPLCDAENHTCLFKFGTKLFPIDISFCHKCGFVFQNPRVSEEQSYAYYRTGIYDKYHRPRSLKIAESSNDAGMITLERVKGFLARNDPSIYLNKIDFKPRICEIGAGDGDVISKFEGGDLFAIEPSENCRKILARKRATVIGESIDARNKNIKFHIILMRHVLEHVYYPKQMLEDVISLLSENGILYIAVPNLLVAHFLNMFTYPHISYFSTYSLTYLCDRVGLKVCKIQDEKYEIWCILKKRIIDKSKKRIVLNKEVLRGSNNLLRKNIEETKRIFRTYKNYPQLLKRSMTRIISNIMPPGLLRSIYERRNKIAKR